MADSDESTEMKWSTISVPRSIADDIRDRYSQEKQTTKYGRDEPLWAFIARYTLTDDGNGGDE